jgi:pimeloyl-ACP methyl ester carboxylesterase
MPSGRPWLGLGCAEPSGRVRRHVHQPVRPAGGYDTATLANDVVALMDALGHQRFAVAGHDTGLWIGYALAADHPDQVAALDLTIEQNERRTARRLNLPVLAIGGSEGIGEGAASTMKLAADDVHSVVIRGSGHYCLEEAPEEVLAALTPFLAPYRNGAAPIGSARLLAAGEERVLHSFWA